MTRLESFRKERERLNKRILETANLETKRFFSLDGQAYRAGALDAKTKELLGLVASMVLRCDDCIAYHVIQCADEGVTDEEFQESFSIATIVGGSIVIPHLRRAVDFLDEVRAEQRGTPKTSRKKAASRKKAPTRPKAVSRKSAVKKTSRKKATKKASRKKATKKASRKR